MSEQGPVQVSCRHHGSARLTIATDGEVICLLCALHHFTQVMQHGWKYCATSLVYVQIEFTPAGPVRHFPVFMSKAELTKALQRKEPVYVR